jgi:hypothetical protein
MLTFEFAVDYGLMPLCRSHSAANKGLLPATALVYKRDRKSGYRDRPRLMRAVNRRVATTSTH